MYRFLLQPRWLAFSLLILVVVPACGALGLWQFQRYGDNKGHADDGAKTSTAPAVPYAELHPDGPVTADQQGRAVTVSGTYDGGHQLLVPGRKLDGRTGSYVLTPLVRSEGGPAVIVVRGWIEGEPQQAPPAPAGPVAVTGRLEVSEAEHTSGADRAKGLEPGQVSMINTPELVNALPFPPADGFVALVSQDPPGDLAPMPADKKSKNNAMSGKAWQNLGYTAQWFVFAAGAVFFWWRVIQRHIEETKEAHEAEVREKLGLPVD